MTRRLSRRALLKNLALWSTAGTAPSAVPWATGDTARHSDEGRILVVVQLGGGNDGLNTVVPCSNDVYYRARPTLALTRDRLIRLTDDLAFNSRLRRLARLFDDGKVAVVQGVGYPGADRSHYRSMEVWHTAGTTERHTTTGWIGRYFDAHCPHPVPRCVAVALGDKPPQAFEGRRRLGAAIRRPEPSGGDPFQPVLELVRAGLGARVYHVVESGFDTHTNQRMRHDHVLGRIGRRLARFQGALSCDGLSERVLTVAFSEFGRRLRENASGGTDHGTAGLMFLVGDHVEPGLHGAVPPLDALDEGDLRHTVDFRSVYAAILRDWLGVNPVTVLRGSFPVLPVIA